MALPALSIITVNLNNITGLQKTFDSVFKQSFTDFEYIVIDGGSTDGSSKLVEKYEDKLAYWVSEKDRGVYHAMNKGIEQSKGEYLLFLNSGDYLCDESVLKNVSSSVLKEDLVYGNIKWETNGIQSDGIFPDKLTFEYLTNASIPHQGTFIRKKLFETAGLYDESYAIISDWIFFILATYKYNCSYKHIDVMIAVCSRDGLSCDPANWQSIVNGRKEVIQKYFSAFAGDYNAFLSLKKELKDLKGTLGYRIQNKFKRIFSK